MRTEEEMYAMILNKAKTCDNIRLVELNGSRVDTRGNADPFQDYDIVYYVQDMEPFLADHSWVDSFGDRIIMQMPDAMSVLAPDEPRESFSYLMLFTDGNRIDLTLSPIALIEESIQTAEPRQILLDKDRRVKSLPSGDNPYLPAKPDQKAFDDCTNEFWWVSTYIAKALWRKELPLAKSLMEGPVRDMLMVMLDWHVGIRTDFAISTGKGGRHLEQYVGHDIWKKLVLTYPDGNYERIWQALFRMCELFEEIAVGVAKGMKFDMRDYSKDVRSYLEHVEKSPKKGGR